MEIFCACPFTVATLGWEPGPGRRVLSVCVKATFTLVRGGAAVLSPLQDPIRNDDAAPDLVPLKQRADVLFTGNIHAPGGVPAESLIARARVGTFQKSLSINGDRTWVPSFEGLRPSPPVPFRRMPLTYDRAVRTGENLAGVDISQGAEAHRPLANIAAIAGQGGETPGLGPLPLLWRARKLGLGDAGIFWASRAGIDQGPPPQGFDFRVFNAAPPEQQLDELSPGTDILLENLHPEHALLATRLPALRVKLFRRPPGSDASAEISTRCDTLWIDTDRGLAITLWRGTVLLDGDSDDEVGQLVVTAEADGERIPPAEIDRMLARFAPDLLYVDPGTLRGEPPTHPAIGDPVPVPAEAAGAPRASYPAPPPPLAGALEPEPRRPPITPLVPPPSERSKVQPLPFRAQSADLEGPSGPRTLETGVPPAPSPPPAQEPDDDAELTPPRGYPAVAELRAAHLGVPSDALPPPRPSAPSIGRFGTIRPDAPISGPGMTPIPPILAPPTVPAAAPVPTPAPPADPALDASATTKMEAWRSATPPAGPALDVYATAKMEAWRSGMPLGEVLARHGIDEAAFRAHEAAQMEALASEAAAGRSEMAIALLDSLNDAERGP